MSRHGGFGDITWGSGIAKKTIYSKLPKSALESRPPQQLDISIRAEMIELQRLPLVEPRRFADLIDSVLHVTRPSNPYRRRA
jgi:hypothetical protein